MKKALKLEVESSFFKWKTVMLFFSFFSHWFIKAKLLFCFEHSNGYLKFFLEICNVYIVKFIDHFHQNFRLHLYTL